MKSNINFTNMAKRILHDAKVVSEDDYWKSARVYCCHTGVLSVKSDGGFTGILLGDLQSDRGYMYIFHQYDENHNCFPKIKELASNLRKIAKGNRLEEGYGKAAYYGEDLQYFADLINAFGLL